MSSKLFVLSLMTLWVTLLLVQLMFVLLQAILIAYTESYPSLSNNNTEFMLTTPSPKYYCPQFHHLHQLLS